MNVSVMLGTVGGGVSSLRWEASAAPTNHRHNGSRQIMAEQKKTVTRETMRTGLDFSPIVLEIGDGTKWSFNRHPSPAQFGTLIEACAAFGELDDKTEHAGTKMTEMATGLHGALVALLDPATQKKGFTDKVYSLAALQWFALAVSEDCSGFPTQ